MRNKSAFLGFSLLFCTLWSHLAISQQVLRDDQVEFVFEYVIGEKLHSNNPRSKNYSPDFLKERITSDLESSRRLTGKIIKAQNAIELFKQSPRTRYPLIAKRLSQEEFSRVRITLRVTYQKDKDSDHSFYRFETFAKLIEYGEVVQSYKSKSMHIQLALDGLERGIYSKETSSHVLSILLNQSIYAPESSSPKGTPQ